MSKTKTINVKLVGTEDKENARQMINTELLGKELPFKGQNYKVAELKEDNPDQLSLVLEGENFDEMNEETHVKMEFQTDDTSYEVNII